MIFKLITIFKLLKNALDNAESIDETILVQRIQQLKVTFPALSSLGHRYWSYDFSAGTSKHLFGTGRILSWSLNDLYGS